MSSRWFLGPGSKGKESNVKQFALMFVLAGCFGVGCNPAKAADPEPAAVKAPTKPAELAPAAVPPAMPAAAPAAVPAAAALDHDDDGDERRDQREPGEQPRERPTRHDDARLLALARLGDERLELLLALAAVRDPDLALLVADEHELRVVAAVAELLAVDVLRQPAPTPRRRREFDRRPADNSR